MDARGCLASCWATEWTKGLGARWDASEDDEEEEEDDEEEEVVEEVVEEGSTGQSTSRRARSMSGKAAKG